MLELIGPPGKHKVAVSAKKKDKAAVSAIGPAGYLRTVNGATEVRKWEAR